MRGARGEGGASHAGKEKIRRGFSKNNMRGFFFELRGRFLLRPAALRQGAAGRALVNSKWRNYILYCTNGFV